MPRPVLIAPDYRTPDAELLAPSAPGASVDPVATPLDLARVPVVLGASMNAGRQRGRKKAARAGDAGGAAESTDPTTEAAELGEDDERDRSALAERPILDREWWQREHRVRDRRTGREHVVTVEGHPSLGLPRASDQGVLIALATLIAEDRERVHRGEPSRIVDGEFTAITVAEVLRAMGYDADKVGSEKRRAVRAALRRFGYVRLTYRSDVIRHTGEHAAELRAKSPAEVAPLVPATTRLAEWTSEEVTWLLDYKWRYDPRTGETWITRLRLNPLFLDQLTSGWVAWVSSSVYHGLKSPLARHLYVFLAGHAALRHELTRFDFSMAEVVEGLALPLKREAWRYLSWLEPVLTELEDAGILRGHHVERARGTFTLRLDAGPILFLGHYLRGTSLALAHEDRMLFAFLSYAGFEPKDAHALIAEEPDVVRSALLYTMYVQERTPERFNRSIRGFVKDRIEHRRTNAGDIGYARWYQQRIAREGLHAAAPSAPALPVADAAPPLERARVIPRSAAATRYFEEALPHIGAQEGMAGIFLDSLQPFDLLGDTLVVTTDSYVTPPTRAQITELLDAALRTVSGGRVARVRIEEYDRRVHGLAAPEREDGAPLADV